MQPPRPLLPVGATLLAAGCRTGSAGERPPIDEFARRSGNPIPRVRPTLQLSDAA